MSASGHSSTPSSANRSAKTSPSPATIRRTCSTTSDLPQVPTWHKGPMVLIGDAAHAPSPSSGQDASMATEDAVVLAKCLRDLPGIPQALAAYERLRRARVERIVAQGARSSSIKAPGPVGRVVRDLLLPVVFKLLVTDRSLGWIYDHHLDWDTPNTDRPIQPCHERPWRASGAHPTRSPWRRLGSLP